ncbi:toxin glutamine deamidase domain-containing protein [Nocardia ignorata]|uniref:toxin glutamine deamidase domain-containing protein n=1 Tax=Nocardia ignorata TaxID=145285 RepID=UPI00362E02E2
MNGTSNAPVAAETTVDAGQTDLTPTGATMSPAEDLAGTVVDNQSPTATGSAPTSAAGAPSITPASTTLPPLSAIPATAALVSGSATTSPAPPGPRSKANRPHESADRDTALEHRSATRPDPTSAPHTAAEVPSSRTAGTATSATPNDIPIQTRRSELEPPSPAINSDTNSATPPTTATEHPAEAAARPGSDRPLDPADHTPTLVPGWTVAGTPTISPVHRPHINEFLRAAEHAAAERDAAAAKLVQIARDLEIDHTGEPAELAARLLAAIDAQIAREGLGAHTAGLSNVEQMEHLKAADAAAGRLRHTMIDVSRQLNVYQRAHDANRDNRTKAEQAAVHEVLTAAGARVVDGIGVLAGDPVRYLVVTTSPDPHTVLDEAAVAALGDVSVRYRHLQLTAAGQIVLTDVESGAATRPATTPQPATDPIAPQALSTVPSPSAPSAPRATLPNGPRSTQHTLSPETLRQVDALGRERDELMESVRSDRVTQPDDPRVQQSAAKTAAATVLAGADYLAALGAHRVADRVAMSGSDPTRILLLTYGDIPDQERMHQLLSKALPHSPTLTSALTRPDTQIVFLRVLVIDSTAHVNVLRTQAVADVTVRLPQTRATSSLDPESLHRSAIDELVAQRDALAQERWLQRAKRDERAGRHGIDDPDVALSPHNLEATVRRLHDRLIGRENVSAQGDLYDYTVAEAVSDETLDRRRKEIAKLQAAAWRVAKLDWDWAAYGRRIAELTGESRGTSISPAVLDALDAIAQERAETTLAAEPYRAMRDDLAARLAADNESPTERRRLSSMLADATRRVELADNMIGRALDRMALLRGAGQVEVTRLGGQMLTGRVGLITGDHPRLIVLAPRTAMGTLRSEPDETLLSALQQSPAVARAFRTPATSVEFKHVIADERGNWQLVDATPPQRVMAGPGRTGLAAHMPSDITIWRDGAGHERFIDPSKPWTTGPESTPKWFGNGKELDPTKEPPKGITGWAMDPIQTSIFANFDRIPDRHVLTELTPAVPMGGHFDTGMQTASLATDGLLYNLSRLVLETFGVFAGMRRYHDPANPARPAFKFKWHPWLRGMYRFTDPDYRVPVDSQPRFHQWDASEHVDLTDPPSEPLREREQNERESWARVQAWADAEYARFRADDSDIDKIIANLAAHDDARRIQQADKVIDKIRKTVGGLDRRFWRANEETLGKLTDWVSAQLREDLRHTAADLIESVLDYDSPVATSVFEHLASTEFTHGEIRQIKNHLMHDRHLVIDRRTGNPIRQRMDAVADIAEAWNRLTDGTPLDDDILLLHNSLVGSRYLVENPDASWREGDRHAIGLGFDWSSHRAPPEAWRAGIKYAPQPLEPEPTLPARSPSRALEPAESRADEALPVAESTAQQHQSPTARAADLPSHGQQAVDRAALMGRIAAAEGEQHRAARRITALATDVLGDSLERTGDGPRALGRALIDRIDAELSRPAPEFDRAPTSPDEMVRFSLERLERDREQERLTRVRAEAEQLIERLIDAHAIEHDLRKQVDDAAVAEVLHAAGATVPADGVGILDGEDARALVVSPNRVTQPLIDDRVWRELTAAGTEIDFRRVVVDEAGEIHVVDRSAPQGDNPYRTANEHLDAVERVALDQLDAIVRAAVPTDAAFVLDSASVDRIEEARGQATARFATAREAVIAESVDLADRADSTARIGGQFAIELADIVAEFTATAEQQRSAHEISLAPEATWSYGTPRPHETSPLAAATIADHTSRANRAMRHAKSAADTLTEIYRALDTRATTAGPRITHDRINQHIDTAIAAAREAVSRDGATQAEEIAHYQDIRTLRSLKSAASEHFSKYLSARDEAKLLSDEATDLAIADVLAAAGVAPADHGIGALPGAAGRTLVTFEGADPHLNTLSAKEHWQRLARGEQLSFRRVFVDEHGRVHVVEAELRGGARDSGIDTPVRGSNASGLPVIAPATASVPPVSPAVFTGPHFDFIAETATDGGAAELRIRLHFDLGIPESGDNSRHVRSIVDSAHTIVFGSGKWYSPVTGTPYQFTIDPVADPDGAHLSVRAPVETADIDEAARLLAVAVREHLGLPPTSSMPNGLTVDEGDVDVLTREARLGGFRPAVPDAHYAFGTTKAREALAPLESESLQIALERAARLPEGGYIRGFDPRNSVVADLINPGGHTVLGRGNNCWAAVGSALLTFHGDPQVAPPVRGDRAAGTAATMADWLRAGLMSWSNRKIDLASFEMLQQYVAELGPGATAPVFVGWQETDAHGTRTLNGHALLVVFPLDAPGPVWWCPQEQAVWDGPPSKYVEGAVILSAIPLRPDGTPALEYTDPNAGAGPAVHYPSIGAHVPGVGLPVRVRLDSDGVLADPRGSAGHAGRSSQVHSEFPVRSDHQSAEHTEQSADRPVHRGDENRGPATWAPAVPAAHPDTPATDIQRNNAGPLPDPTAIPVRGERTGGGLPADDRQTGLGVQPDVLSRHSGGALDPGASRGDGRLAGDGHTRGLDTDGPHRQLDEPLGDTDYLDSDAPTPTPGFDIGHRTGQSPITELTLRIHLRPVGEISPAELADIRALTQRATAEIFEAEALSSHDNDDAQNSPMRLPDGTTLHVRSEFVDDPEAAHLRVPISRVRGLIPQGIAPDATSSEIAMYLRNHFGLQPVNNSPNKGMRLDGMELYELRDEIAHQMAAANTGSPLPPIADARAYAFHPPVALEHQHYQEELRAAALDGDRYTRGADPRTHPTARLINPGGRSTQSRSANCWEAAVAAIMTFNGAPTVARAAQSIIIPGRLPEYHGIGDLDAIRQWLGAESVDLAHGPGSPADRLHALIAELGPGASAFVGFTWPSGMRHILVVVYPVDASGPVWWDAQSQETWDAPPREIRELDALNTIPIRADGSPFRAATDQDRSRSQGVPREEPPMGRPGNGDRRGIHRRLGDPTSPGGPRVPDRAADHDPDSRNRSDLPVSELVSEHGDREVPGSDTERRTTRTPDLPLPDPPAPDTDPGRGGPGVVPDATGVTDPSGRDRTRLRPGDLSEELRLLPDEQPAQHGRGPHPQLVPDPRHLATATDSGVLTDTEPPAPETFTPEVATDHNRSQVAELGNQNGGDRVHPADPSPGLARTAPGPRHRIELFDPTAGGQRAALALKYLKEVTGSVAIQIPDHIEPGGMTFEQFTTAAGGRFWLTNLSDILERLHELGDSYSAVGFPTDYDYGRDQDWSNAERRRGLNTYTFVATNRDGELSFYDPGTHTVSTATPLIPLAYPQYRAVYFDSEGNVVRDPSSPGVKKSPTAFRDLERPPSPHPGPAADGLRAELALTHLREKTGSVAIQPGGGRWMTMSEVLTRAGHQYWTTLVQADWVVGHLQLHGPGSTAFIVEQHRDDSAAANLNNRCAVLTNHGDGLVTIYDAATDTTQEYRPSERTLGQTKALFYDIDGHPIEPMAALAEPGLDDRHIATIDRPNGKRIPAPFSRHALRSKSDNKTLEVLLMNAPSYTKALRENIFTPHLREWINNIDTSLRALPPHEGIAHHYTTLPWTEAVLYQESAVVHEPGYILATRRNFKPLDSSLNVHLAIQSKSARLFGDPGNFYRRAGSLISDKQYSDIVFERGTSFSVVNRVLDPHTGILHIDLVELVVPEAARPSRRALTSDYTEPGIHHRAVLAVTHIRAMTASSFIQPQPVGQNHMSLAQVNDAMGREPTPFHDPEWIETYLRHHGHGSMAMICVQQQGLSKGKNARSRAHNDQLIDDAVNENTYVLTNNHGEITLYDPATQSTAVFSETTQYRKTGRGFATGFLTYFVDPAGMPIAPTEPGPTKVDDIAGLQKAAEKSAGIYRSRVSPQPITLTSSDRAALRTYDDDLDSINEELRADAGTRWTASTRFHETLAKFSDYHAVVYRVETLPIETLLADYIPGEIVRDPGHATASKKRLPTVAGDVEFTILSSTGKDLGHYFRRTANSIVFGLGTEFQVISRHLNPDTGVMEVALMETGDLHRALDVATDALTRAIAGPSTPDTDTPDTDPQRYELRSAVAEHTPTPPTAAPLVDIHRVAANAMTPAEIAAITGRPATPFSNSTWLAHYLHNLGTGSTAIVGIENQSTTISRRDPNRRSVDFVLLTNHGDRISIYDPATRSTSPLSEVSQDKFHGYKRFHTFFFDPAGTPAAPPEAGPVAIPDTSEFRRHAEKKQSWYRNNFSPRSLEINMFQKRALRKFMQGPLTRSESTDFYNALISLPNYQGLAYRVGSLQLDTIISKYRPGNFVLYQDDRIAFKSPMPADAGQVAFTMLMATGKDVSAYARKHGNPVVILDSYFSFQVISRQLNSETGVMEITLMDSGLVATPTSDPDTSLTGPPDRQPVDSADEQQVSPVATTTEPASPAEDRTQPKHVAPSAQPLGEILTPPVAEAHARYGSDTEAGVAHHSDDPAMADLAGRVHRDDRYFTADVRLDDAGAAVIGGRRFSPEEYGDLLRHHTRWDGRSPIRLIGCDAASGPFAARLATHLGTDVLAPTARAWTDEHGRVYTSAVEIDSIGNRRPRLPPDGEWVTHHPDGTTTLTTTDGFAPGTPVTDRSTLDPNPTRPTHEENTARPIAEPTITARQPPVDVPFTLSAHAEVSNSTRTQGNYEIPSRTSSPE